MSSVYKIGQYRYTGGGCLSTVPTTNSYFRTSFSLDGSGESTAFFTDVGVKFGDETPLSPNEVYYVHAEIPQDVTYVNDLNVRLQSTSAITTSPRFQQVRAVTVPQGSNNTITPYNVALYGYGDPENETVAAMIPRVYQTGVPTVVNQLYWDKSSDTYYLGDGGSGTVTTRINTTKLSPIWRSEESDNKYVIDLVFQPVEGDFVDLVFQISRNQEDYNIRNEDGSFGRKIELSDCVFQVSRVTNLIATNIGSEIALSRVGVWGRPGLMLAVNGEEIKIGRAGFYELNNVLEITSLGVVAKSFEDNFSIDYAYTEGND